MNNNLDNNLDNNLVVNEIDAAEVLRVIWKSKLIVLTISLLVAILTLIYSFSLPNLYKSKALLSPVAEKNSMNSAMQSYSGIASLAGINLSSPSGSNNAVKALDKLRSLSFFQDNIMPNIFLPDLMAIESWDASNNTIHYDDAIYDENKKMWIRDYEYPQTKIPSAQESFQVFIDNHLSVAEDSETFFVTIAIKHPSPYIAQEWTELIVKELNNFFRIKDKAEAQAAVNFLNAQLSQTTFNEVKLAIAELLQSKTQQLTLIEVNDFYVFDYIDPPAVMEKKSEPKRGLMLIIGAFFGGILGMIFALFRHYLTNKKT